ncbi:MAG: hypothetical protein ACETWQ_00955 [Phycisphaerae bacterium]
MAGNKYPKKTIVILCAAIVVFTLAGCKKETPAPDSDDEIAASPSEDLVVEPSEALVIELGVGVGPVRFGMSKEEVIKHIGQPDKIEAVMQDVVRLDYISSRGLLFGLNPTVGINYIKCYSEGYPGFYHVTTFAERTKKGVTMGASRNQIITAYGEPDRTDSKGRFTILYYDNLRSELITTDNKLVGIKMVSQL